MMAELMLRRTRSDQVAQVYSRFTRNYRNAARASEDPDGVRSILQSLGLNWRNEQMLDTIQYVSHRFGNRHAPSAGDDLTEIPGVGDYCNSMLRSRLFGESRAAIDSNVARIYCRLVGEPYDPEVRRKKWLKDLSGRFMELATAQSNPAARKGPGPAPASPEGLSHAMEQATDPFEINLAFLDLAALLCRPSQPRCLECPLRKHCEFAKSMQKS